MQDTIGFSWQPPLSGACGKYSMQHALLLLGIPVTEKEANKATNVPPYVARLFGTNEKQLKQGLRYFGCRAIEYSFMDPDKLRKELDNLLSIGCPVILSVQDGMHWAVIAGKESKTRYYWIDSADDELIGYWDWSNIVDWIEGQEYYLIGVKPKDESQLRHSLVPNYGKVYSLLDDDELCEYWGYYLEDLNEMFDCPVDGTDGFTAKEFFEKYGNMVFNASCYYYVNSDERMMRSELDRYKKVAMAHDLTISRETIPEAIANLSAALTCIACLES